MLENLITPDIAELLDEGDLVEVREILESWVPVDLAGIIAALSREKRLRLIETLSAQAAAQAFAYLDPELQETLIHELREPVVAAIVD